MQTQIILVKAIQSLRPTAEYKLTNGDYSTIEWIKLEGNPPTQSEIDIAIETIKSQTAQVKAQAQAKRTAALAKLEALGLDEDDLKALGL